jgi:hypothetical protein
LKFGKTPKDIAKLDQKQARAFLLDIVSAFEREGKNGGYIANFVKPTKNWLEFNGITIQQKIVPVADVKNWIVQGWEYVVTLPTNEAVVRLPLSHLSVQNLDENLYLRKSNLFG